MSLLQADLPSEDEADDDYDPNRDDKADDTGPVKGKQTGTKRRRGSAMYPGASADESAVEVQTSEHVDDSNTPAELAKRSKVDQLWAQLNKGKTSQPTATAVKQKPAPALDAVAPGAESHKQMSLAAFCRPVPKKQKAGSDADWKRQLGITSTPQETPIDEDSQKRAAAAAAAAAATAHRKLGPQTVTETRRFAGKDIQYKRAATERDQSTKSEDIKKGGLDALLGSLQQAKKVNVLDKSRMDWGDFKSSDVKVDEELEGYKKSGDKYLDKVDFLKRAELRQYEQERDQRLSRDMRSRGRL